MVRPVQVDGIWDKKHLAYNKYMASLLPRSMYYRLQKFLRTDVTDLLEECNSVWSAAMDIGGAVCGDEAIVPHTGGRCMGLQQYIARKPHATDIKLYVLADNTGGYVVDVYLYTGRRGLGRVQGTSMPSASWGSGHDSSHLGPCSWPIASSEAMPWHKTSRPVGPLT